MQIPSGEYYLLKDKGTGFIFVPRATASDTGLITLGVSACIPKELIGKRLMFHCEIVEVVKNAKKR